MIPELNQETGEISDALGRGRHTIIMYRFMKSRRRMDCRIPGFSTVDFMDIEKKTYHLFPEFVEVEHECKFRECSRLQSHYAVIAKSGNQETHWKLKRATIITSLRELDQKENHYEKSR